MKRFRSSVGPWVLLSLVWLAGCASSYRVRDPGEINANRLFPDGTYRHEVTLTLPNGQRHQFQGVVKLAPDRIEVVGLSFFNTTVFRVIDDLKAEPQVTIYIPQLKPQEGKVRRMYAMLKKMMLLPPGEIEHAELPGGAHLKLAGYDDHHIPRTLRIASDKFVVDVKVTGYEI